MRMKKSQDCIWPVVALLVVLLSQSVDPVEGFASLQSWRISFGPSSPSRRQCAFLWQSSSDDASSLLVDGKDPALDARCYLDRTNVALSFPSYRGLMDCNYGEFLASEPFVCGDAKFCVKLYPRGGGHGRGSTTNSEPQQGFGMAYKVLPMVKGNENNMGNQRVGLYLQYLGRATNTAGQTSSTVDASFALRLKGNQRMGRKFDLEWRAGMRFVPPDQTTQLSKGRANDFGAHLMQTPLLQEFMGISDDRLEDPTPLMVNAEVVLHDTVKELSIQRDNSFANGTGDEELEEETTSFFGAWGEDIRTPSEMANKDQQHDGKRVRVGKVVVPILSRLSQRPKMFEMGAYPGVEYRILRILDPKTGMERFTSCPGCEYELKPIYPLVAQLERPWPVQVNEADIPRLYTPTMYNVVSAVGSLATAVTGLATAFLVSQAISLFFIPSRSMDPTLQVGDILLVDKLSPRLLKNQKSGDIVLFSPPSELRDIVAANGGKLTSRDLFVKRVVGQGGDTIAVDGSGRVQINGQPAPGKRDLCEAEPLRLIEKYVKTKEETLLAKDEVFVMGDCSSVSIDSRVWGPLQSSEIVGKPLLRFWPLDRFGPLTTLQPLTTTTDEWED